MKSLVESRRGMPPSGITPDLLAPSRVDTLATADGRKDEFLATVCHELRTPLAAIQNAFRLLTSENADIAARQRAQILVERQIRRMMQLLDGLQDISRIRYGRLHFRRERLDLRVVVRNAIETLESEIKGRDHHLNTELSDAPLWVYADPLRLEQVFLNLLSNASKYMDAGGELTVRVHRRDALAIVRVRDSGIGIARDALPYIFDLFIPPKSEVRLYYDIAENGGLRVIVGVPLLTHTTVRQGCRGLAYCYRLSHWIAATSVMWFIPAECAAARLA